MVIKRFVDLEIWKISRELYVQILNITAKDSFNKDYRFKDQIRSSSGSITDNIAEGFGWFEKRDKTRFYKISRGSCYELISQTLVSYALHYITNDSDKPELENGYKEIINELDALIKTIEKN